MIFWWGLLGPSCNGISGNCFCTACHQYATMELNIIKSKHVVGVKCFTVTAVFPSIKMLKKTNVTFDKTITRSHFPTRTHDLRSSNALLSQVLSLAGLPAPGRVLVTLNFTVKTQYVASLLCYCKTTEHYCF